MTKSANLIFLVSRTARNLSEISQKSLEVLESYSFQGRTDFIPADNAITFEVDWDGRRYALPQLGPTMWVLGTENLGMKIDQLVDLKQELINKCHIDVVFV